MRTLLPAVVAALLSATNASAASCFEQASEQKLKGNQKSEFLKKCRMAVNQTPDPKCVVKAADRKLAGAAYHAFMQKCQGKGTDRDG